MTTATAQLATAPAADAIRPFRVNIPETALADLRRRLAQTRLPEKETVADYSQGVPLKTIQQVLRYWQTDYDWRKVEARLNAVPNFITEIDDLDIHSLDVGLSFHLSTTRTRWCQASRLAQGLPRQPHFELFARTFSLRPSARKICTVRWASPGP